MNANYKTNHIVQAKIDNLYQIFAPYRLNPHMEGCPCCVYDEDQNRIRSKPLQELTVSDLSKYAYKALTTWGNEDDYRHFIPRLFEIITFETVALTDPEILFGKLSYAQWRKWPLKEQKAIEDYFFALWQYQLTEVEPEDYTNVGSYLCGIALSVGNIESYLTAWETESSQTAIKHLHLFIVHEGENLRLGKLNFWKDCPEQAKQVAQWISKQEHKN